MKIRNMDRVATEMIWTERTGDGSYNLIVIKYLTDEKQQGHMDQMSVNGIT